MPAQAGIQFSRRGWAGTTDVAWWLLDHPLSRMMTAA